jgi:phage tail sheath protein FI
MSTSSKKNLEMPGVYVTEANAFPHSIQGAQTAVPAFIGYTAKAAIDGKPAYLTPVKLNSLTEYEAVFGGSFVTKFEIKEAGLNTGDFAAQKWVTDHFELKYFTLSRVTTGNENAATAPPPAAFNLYNSVRLFYANGGQTCYVCSAGDYAEGIDASKLNDGLAAVGEQVGPTLLAIPDAVLLKSSGNVNNMPVSAAFDEITRQMLAQCAKLQDRVAILDVYGTDAIDPTTPKNGTYSNDVNAVIDNFHQSVGDPNLNYEMAYFPFLVTSIVQPSEIDFTNFHVTGANNTWTLLQRILTDQAAHLYPGATPGPANDDNPTFKKAKGWIDLIPATTDPAAITRLNQSLLDALPLLGQMENGIACKLNLLPPGGAMAGVCALIDSTRGVWNAPANIVLDSVVQSSAKISDDQQGPINVPFDGKAVNVIRDFVGRGPVVWGARTLDGNSNDWRYVQVRRTLVYIETSIRTALNQFVFAPNDAKTWVAVTAMVSGFLQDLWSQGGLMGDKASDAFTVQCGLGSTMTGLDILQGYMIVQVTLQMIHPAEFIELTFKQKMQGVG